MHNGKKMVHKKKKKIKLILFIVILIIISIIVIHNNKKDNVEGVWAIDDVTKYEFDGNGNGKLILPSVEYNFIYKIDNDKIIIDFENETSKDSSYKFYIEDEKLILEGINETSGNYILNKQN